MKNTASVYNSVASNTPQLRWRSAVAWLSAPFIPLLLAAALPAQAGPIEVINLVTDDQSISKAMITDVDLKNAWGVSFGPTTPFWVSSNGAGTSTLYRVDPVSNATTKVPLVVTIPGTMGASGNPTGQVFNGGNGFNGSNFLFVSEDGTVSGWKSGTTAQAIVQPSASNVYKGAAIADIGGTNYLYAANFKTGKIDVINGSTNAPDPTKPFSDPNLPSNLSPFNIQNLNGNLYVTYAVPDANRHDDVEGLGNGAVDEFDTQGKFIKRIATGGNLDSPWGVAIAPTSFGALANHLLVGNFGDGQINAFDLNNPSNPSQVLTGKDGKAIVIDGLWALTRGNGSGAGSTQEIFFSAGPGGEEHGLFGVMRAVPEPNAYAFLGLGLSVLWFLKRRRRGLLERRSSITPQPPVPSAQTRAC